MNDYKDFKNFSNKALINQIHYYTLYSFVNMNFLTGEPIVREILDKELSDMKNELLIRLEGN